MPRKGCCNAFSNLFVDSLIVTPIIVDIVNSLFSYWLKKNDKNDNR
ncbi:type I toxin-antitoxin system Fst family toxin (plasmid) [Weissella paramesenteroides]|nr:type I toxin-antitoxin system Fst family toxin [Weissella paramesenteroides]